MNPTPVLVFLGTSFLVASISFLLLRQLTRRGRIRKASSLLATFDQNISNGEIDKQDSSFIKPIRSLLIHPYGRWLRGEANKAGIWRDAEIERLMNQKVLLTLFALVVSALLLPLLDLPFLDLLLIPIFSFMIPDILILQKRRRRVQSIVSSLPETIDLISMCVTAGIGFHAGMQRVADTKSNPLSEEFGRVLSEMQLGVPRSQALLSLTQRFPIDELKTFVNSILQVDRLGIPMAKVLEEQSLQMRNLRRERAREQAQKLPVKILAPIILFMLPALLIIVLGPAAVTILKSFS